MAEALQSTGVPHFPSITQMFSTRKGLTAHGFIVEAITAPAAADDIVQAKRLEPGAYRTRLPGSIFQPVRSTCGWSTAAP
jgi:hypothetical protein